MKLKDYLKQLNDLVKENPEILTMEVITSKDDEGNGFNKVHYSPSFGHFDGDNYDSNSRKINAVCLN